MNEEQMRAEFEAWFAAYSISITPNRLAKDRAGKYLYGPALYAWAGWKAAMAGQAALSAKSVPDGSFIDLEDSDYVAKRFRLVLSKLGISTPESDEELLLGAFSYLGMARRALEDILTAPQPPTDDRVRELEKLEECRDFILELNTSGFIAGESKLAKHLAERMETLYHTIDHVMKGETS